MLGRNCRAAAAINAGARVCLTTQHIVEKALMTSASAVDHRRRRTHRPSRAASSSVRRCTHPSKRAASPSTRRLAAATCAEKAASRASSCRNVSLSRARARGRCAEGVVCLSRRGSYQGALIGSNRAPALCAVALTGDNRAPRPRLAASASARKSRANTFLSPDATRPLRRRHDRAHTRLASPSRRAHSTNHRHRRRVFQRLLRRARRACPPTSPSTGAMTPTRIHPTLALSYGCAILCPCVGALRRRIPRHRARAHRQRPSLALDLVDLLVDQTVIALRARASSGPARRRRAEPGVWLGSDGKKILVDAYGPPASHRRHPGYSGSWRRHIARRANAGARARTGRRVCSVIYIIAYDIADSKRRLRVAKTHRLGLRIQEIRVQLRLDTATLACVLGSAT